MLYITERCVLRLDDHGPELIEIAPGADLERDVLAQMGFRPRIAPDLREMDAAIFTDAPLGLATHGHPAPSTGTPPQRSARALQTPARAAIASDRETERR